MELQNKDFRQRDTQNIIFGYNGYNKQNNFFSTRQDLFSVEGHRQFFLLHRLTVFSVLDRKPRPWNIKARLDVCEQCTRTQPKINPVQSSKKCFGRNYRSDLFSNIICWKHIFLVSLKQNKYIKMRKRLSVREHVNAP